MNRSVSEPSLGTIGTAATISKSSRHNVQQLKSRLDRMLISCSLWEGRSKIIILGIVSIQNTTWWQVLIILSIIYAFISHLLIGFYLEPREFGLFDVTIGFTQFIFLVDVCISLLNVFWPTIRLHIRVQRRSFFFLTFDVISLIPLIYIFQYIDDYKWVILLGRWLEICRIYRMFTFFHLINDSFQENGAHKLYLVVEHLIMVCLVLHIATCLWYSAHFEINKMKRTIPGYPVDVATQTIKFQNYITCWYFCSCRFFNVIFGDTIPSNDLERWLTSALMLLGFVFMRYRFIGSLAWEITLQNGRRATFIDQYHHMLQYLSFRDAPTWLLKQAKNYKRKLWTMKDGILYSDHLQNLPLPFQMELIFDINVGHFHSTLLFRDTDESFMRQISLLMRHEIFLAGQHIWSQDVVKFGLICIKRGVLEMLSDEDDESPMIAFKEGTVLGELSLFHSVPSKVTVKAATYVELQILRRTDLMRVIAEHPQMLNHLREKINTRLKNVRKRQEAIEEYDRGDSRLIRTRYRPMKVLKDQLAGIEDEDPTFVDDSHLYYKDENNVRHRKFTTEYLELYQLSKNVTTVNTPMICLRAKFPWILEPNTGFTQVFDFIHFTTVLYVALSAPFFAIKYNASDTEKVLTTIVTALLLFNLYLQLTTAIFDKDGRKETVREIAEVKMATPGFYLDLLSVFPAYIFTDTLDPQNELVVGQVALLFPCFQTWHIWDYVTTWEKNFHSNEKFLCLVKFGLMFMVLSYWSGCFLYIYACPRKLCNEGSWMAVLIYWETKIFLVNDAKYERPITSALAFGSGVFSGNGLSDIAPGSSELFPVVLIFVLGAYMGCFYIANMCSIYLLSTQRKLKFKESMRELFYFLSANHVSGKIKSRVKKFFCVQWYYNNAVSADEIFKDMSENMKQDIMSVEIMDTLQQCHLFKDCSRDFLQTVASKTSLLVFPDNEVVQHAGDIGRDMYILQKGHCNLLNHDGKLVRSIGPGTSIADVFMLFGLPKMYTVLTSTNCILIYLEYSQLVQCWSIFPENNHLMQEVIEDEEIREKTAVYELMKPVSGRIDVKQTRITQEIKESLIMLTGTEARSQFVQPFEKMGILKFLRFFFLPGVITPHGLFLKLWCAVRSILAIYYIFIIPYHIAIKQSRWQKNFLWTDIILDIDVVIMSYVAYYNEDSLLIVHPLLTVTKYLKTAFIFDAICIFPFEYLFRIVNDQIEMDLYRVNRILLVARITGAFQYWESDIMRTNQAVVLLKFLPLGITFVNFITALVFMSACKPFIMEEVVWVNCTRSLTLSASSYDIDYAISEYIRTFFWVLQFFIGCGCTPTTISCSTDVYLTIVLQFVGFLYFAFMIGHVASYRSATAHALLEHTEKTKDLANFLFQQNVDQILTVKTLKYFEYVWKRTNGSNPQEICRRLNSALMEDTLAYMYERALREVPLFGKVDRSFVRVFTQYLHEMYFLKGETVIQCKDIQPFIYIIYRGKVDVLTSYNEMLTCMGPGGMFGNFTGQPIASSAVSIYASRSLDLLVIPSQEFFNLVKYYPKLQEPLKKAFEFSKDYILPITMDINNSSDEESTDSGVEDELSQNSGFDSRSGSGKFDAGRISLHSSHSTLSQAKSTASVVTLSDFMDVLNLFTPGTWLFQAYSYFCCAMTTANYVLLTYELVTLNHCPYIMWAQSIFDIFFYIKIYLRVHQGYVSKHGDLVLDTKKCRRRYFRHKWWFWMDLMANFPLELLGLISSQPLVTMHYLRCNKILRLKYLYEFYHQTESELTNNLTILQSTMTAVVVVILIHTFTCAWLLSLIATKPISVIRLLKVHLLEDFNYNGAAQRTWDYTSSFYVVVSIATTTGGDEFLLSEEISIGILTIALICGQMLAATVVAAALQVAYSTKYALTTYEIISWELIDMLKNQGLSKYQLKKLWTYIKQLWASERGRQLPALLHQTPYVRRCDLMSAMFGHHLRNCYIFMDTGEPFLRQLTAALEYTVFFPGNYIVVAGDCEARMYWLASGTVSVVSVRSDLTETTHELLTAGDSFGILQGLNRGVSHCFSYKADTKVGILALNLDSWINILPFFPEAQDIIQERSQILFAKI